MIKSVLLKVRNHVGAMNRIRVSRESRFHNSANLLHTHIQCDPHNTVILEKGARLRKLRIFVIGKSNRLHIKANALVSGHIEMFGNGNSVVIGDSTRINGAVLSAHNGTSISIGSNCLLSNNIDIRTTDSHKILDAKGERINPDQNVTIFDRVWVGMGVSILKGAVISSDTVIGAHAVVTGEIPSNSVAAGMPAKVIKTGITWQE
jgi:acetyltransferase-like isoleucine patch superfamily enzyme